MTTWYTSDTHFWHLNIIKYCNRPFANVHEMNQTMIKNWNEVVKDEDTIFHLGDVAMGNRTLLEIVRELKGHKVLIKGNHDRSINTMLQYFDEAYESMVMTIGGWRTLLQHRPQEGLKEPRQICGHVHDSWKKRGNILNVGVDQWDFRPISEETVIQQFV